MPQDPTEEGANKDKPHLDDLWAIRPCSMYKEEYSDCTSIKARFNQYFIFGHNIDCSQWLVDYKNCIKYEDSNGNDVDAGKAVIKSEEERRVKRLQAHYANTTWKKRKAPPEDWAKPLPEWLAKKNENSFLEIKANELAGKTPEDAGKTYCTVM